MANEKNTWVLPLDVKVDVTYAVGSGGGGGAGATRSAIGNVTEQRIEGWVRVPPPPEPPCCDICQAKANWQHPAGGFRCGFCPRPER